MSIEEIKVGDKRLIEVKIVEIDLKNYQCIFWEYVHNEALDGTEIPTLGKTGIKHYDKLLQSKEKEIEELQHFKTTALGLWVTDKPETIPEEIKHLFFKMQ